MTIASEAYPEEQELTDCASDAEVVTVQVRRDCCCLLPPNPDKVTCVNSDPQSWLSESCQRLFDLRTLRPNWDGEGSPRIEEAIICAARDVLALLISSPTDAPAIPVPHASPLHGGSLQLEWWVDDGYLEFEFIDETTIRAIGRKGSKVRFLGRVGIRGREFQQVIAFLE